MRIQEWFQGYKVYILLASYCVFVVVTGQVPEGTESALGGMDEAAIKELLMAGVVGALKAKWNRVTAGS
jgi:hypothetical protein